MMPRCLGTSNDVRASSMANAASRAPVVQTFWPLTTHSSPSRSARVVSPARSDPLPGSENSWHHFSSPVTMPRRRRRPNSSLPCRRMVGAARLIPEPAAGPTAPTRANSSATTAAAAGSRPRP